MPGKSAPEETVVPQTQLQNATCGTAWNQVRSLGVSELWGCLLSGTTATVPDEHKPSLSPWEKTTKIINMLIQYTFTECSVCVKHWLVLGNTVASESDTAGFLRFADSPFSGQL